jgi:hypothetical protein
MEKTAHTWTTQKPEPDRFPHYVVRDENGDLVAHVPIMAHGKTDKHLALIAAAPDLLEALKEMISHFEELDDGDGTIYKARAVVARATGAQP